MGDIIEGEVQEGCVSENFKPGNFNPLSEDIVEYIFNSLSAPFKNCEELNARKKAEVYLKLQKSLSSLSLPPKYTTVRVNLQKITLEDAVKVIDGHLKDYQMQKNKQKTLIYPHQVIPDLIVIESLGLRKISPKKREVIVGQLCGSAVLRGADVYAPGVLGASPGLHAGGEVAVYVDLDGKCLRGCKEYKGRKMFIGNGTASLRRLDLFRLSKPVGLAVAMEDKIFDCPSLGNFRNDVLFLQNLPSILCSRVLHPPKGGIVLDMCAAPGGKTTHLATLVGNSGRVIAIDRSQRKISQIKENAEKLGLTNISAFVYDSTKLVFDDQLDCKRLKVDVNFCKISHSNDASDVCPPPPYAPSSFKLILLDAPCSALGQRPQIHTKCSAKALKSFPILQRKLFESAVKLLSVGGTLVYSTCTIVAEENENMVRWVLDNFSGIELIDQHPLIGQPGLSNCGLTYDQCRRVQRFGPVITDSESFKVNLEQVDRDTIGFFIAAFTKIS